MQRLEKLLEDAGIKLSSVANDIVGASGRAMLEALIAGADDPAVLADLSQRRLRDKIPQLVDALTGRFTAHHGLLARTYLDLIDQHTRAIETITTQIDTEMAPFHRLHDQIRTIPGIGPISADVIIAETGADLSRFPTAGNLASWAGLTPGHNESAGKHRSSRTRPGNPYPQNALGIAAMVAARHPDTYLGARYRRIAARRGAMRANVAVQHTILTTIWHMTRTGENYHDLGGDYFTQLNPDRAVKHAIHQLQAVGYRVTLEPATA